MLHFHASPGCTCVHCERAARLVRALRSNRESHAHCSSSSCAACAARSDLVAFARERVNRLASEGKAAEAQAIDRLIHTHLDASQLALTA